MIYWMEELPHSLLSESKLKPSVPLRMFHVFAARPDGSDAYKCCESTCTVGPDDFSKESA